MPRGIPNVKKDEKGFKYSVFQVPSIPNPKHISSTYLKSEAQTHWYRKNLAKGKGPELAEEGSSDGRRGSHVLVIHPGSRYMRIGRASDVAPLCIPNVVARKDSAARSQSPRLNCIIRPGGSENDVGPSFHPPVNGDEYDVVPASSNSFDTKLAIITVALRDRMRFYKLRVTPNAAAIASTFNEQFKPEVITSDPNRIHWLDSSTQDEVLVGDEALRLGDPEALGYSMRWPIHGLNFNSRDYPSIQLILSDLEAVIEHTLRDKLGILRKDFKSYSVVFVIPDFYDRAYVREFVQLLLVTMGFKQLCAQQESLAATYGAGMSNACVVDIGATVTKISCVDEGLVLPDSRLCLNVGGDDITEFLYVLLQGVKFPYRDCDLSRSYDWAVIENLKCRICTLQESDVALNLYDFVVRRPNRQTEKYGLRAYDEVILAPMCIFEPRVIDFEAKRRGLSPLSPNVTEEILSHQTDNITKAMIISTQHLMPPIGIDPPQSAGLPVNGGPMQNEPMKAEADPHAMAVDHPDGTGPSNPIEVIDVDEEKLPNLDFSQAPPPRLPPPDLTQRNIDVPFEASKLPLDVAIFNSARAAGGDDKIRKYLQAVLVIGGTANIPGIDHALESRLQAIATPLVPNMEKVQIIPPPKGVDPSTLSWKGASVLGKMESVSELWITPSDWDLFGMRALKERCFYL